MSVTSGGTAPKPCSSGGSSSASAGSAGIVIALRIFQSPSSRYQCQTEAERSSTETTTPTNPHWRRGSCAGPQLEHHLVLVADVERLQVLPATEIADVHRVAVLAPEQFLGNDAVLEHRGCSPLARHERVLVQVPPEVVLIALVAMLALPGSERLEGLAVELEDAARLVGAVRAAEAAHVDRVGATVRGVRARVAGLGDQLCGLDRLDDLRRARVILACR